jgi:AcrR family transcriptional regulator
MNEHLLIQPTGTGTYNRGVSPRPRATSDAAILAAAFRVVARLGPTLTLADVAREAGVSPATLVQRFGSKRRLLLALTSGASSGVAAEYARIRAAHRSPIAALFAVGDCMAAMAGTPEMMANSLAFLQIDLTDPEFHRHAHAHSRATHVELKALIDEAVRAGELRRCNSARLARAVQSLMGGSLLGWAIDRDTKVEDRVRQDMQVLLEPHRVPSRPRRPRGARRSAKAARSTGALH